MKEEDDDYVPCWRRVYTVCCFVMLLIVGNVVQAIFLVGKEKDKMHIVAQIQSLSVELASLEEANASLTEFNEFLMETFGMSGASTDEVSTEWLTENISTLESDIEELISANESLEEEKIELLAQIAKLEASQNISSGS